MPDHMVDKLPKPFAALSLPVFASLPRSGGASERGAFGFSGSAARVA